MKRLGRLAELSNRVITRLNKLTPLQASTLITVIGLAVFSTGLFNQFIGDDFSQIVNNIPVHSLKNIPQFFSGGTFYNGAGSAPLVGSNFRPLMTVSFSLIYSVFGLHTFGYHFIQLIFVLGSTILLYFVFKYIFKPAQALFLALVFLVHPLNSQNVFAIANLQDVLYFFFGILAMWLLMRYKSLRILPLVALCLFLSLLSKETAVVFIIMAIIYLFWFSRRRLLTFLWLMILPIGLYLALRIHAVGIKDATNIAPIDFYSLGGRLMNIPSILLFFIEKFLFPWKLASAYYWVHSSFSLTNFLLPVIIDLLVISLATYVGTLIHRRMSKSLFITYMFFGLWTAFGLLPTLQIIPLDMTVSEAWFYFPMVGMLGMIGIAAKGVLPKLRRDVLLTICLTILLVLGVRTSLRGLDWRNQYVLAYSDIKVSSQDYNAYDTISRGLTASGNYRLAKKYALISTKLQPSYTNYNSLGLIDMHLGDYSEAEQAFNHGLKYGDAVQIHENLCALAIVYGTRSSDNAIFIASINQFPKDSQMWEYLAFYFQMNGDNSGAKTAITKAAEYGQIPQALYENIMNNKPFTLNINNFGLKLNIP